MINPSLSREGSPNLARHPLPIPSLIAHSNRKPYPRGLCVFNTAHSFVACPVFFQTEAGLMCLKLSIGYTDQSSPRSTLSPLIPRNSLSSVNSTCLEDQVSCNSRSSEFASSRVCAFFFEYHSGQSGLWLVGRPLAIHISPIRASLAGGDHIPTGRWGGGSQPSAFSSTGVPTGEFIGNFSCTRPKGGWIITVFFLPLEVQKRVEGGQNSVKIGLPTPFSVQNFELVLLNKFQLIFLFSFV